ncbi:DUF4350 domain-containing protein [Jiangella aurantiaca]|uniref:DUF4350 domain-containing protein n=1 Tax=Jiangella aurantiaca TaxID=2530373 RepID=A0A4R5AK70_9ACTN|nr:DUF4350 domain-containing protein [Jiangella aurantiaca]TDD73033.1 DUF4350 domain-containing protein [Jiangella aurantiaca]
MSTTTTAPESRPLDPTGADVWRRWRRPLAVVVLLLLTAVILGIVQSRAGRGYLDPEGVDNPGARALARLLADQGVDITPVRAGADAVAAAGPHDTVLVTVPDLLTSGQIDRLIDTGARLVLVAPELRVPDYAPGLSAVLVDEPGSVEPGCELPVAERAGSVRLGGLGYSGDVSRSEGATCYPVDGEPSLAVTATEAGSQVVLLGTADPLTNEHLDDDGNAALALGLLGQTERLVWYRPIPEQGADAPAAFTDQLPGWVRAGAWQLAIAALLAAAWRARRLGRLVTEPLPVVVRASETTEGRARLYRRGRSREHAAMLLRTAAIRRLAATAHLHAGELGPDAVDTLVTTLATRTGRPAVKIAALLTGPPPADDAALVRLADDLDALENAGVPRATGTSPTGKDPRPS